MTTRDSRVSTLWQLSAIAVALACAFSAGNVQANGLNPTVVAGQAGFSTQGSALSVTNSPGAIINWQGFSIGASEATRFIQQSAASSVLNRVIGPDPSVILGTLTSNGRVFLINPSGIMVGQGARIDVAGLVASTLNLSNQDFLAGRLNFMSNPLAGRVENQGSITTPSGGSVYLVGANVTNSGIINSPQGDVILAAGQSVKIFDTSTPGVRVELAASDNKAVNLGEILVQSGQVGIYGALLRNSGVINADQVGRDAAGKIVLRAKQDVTLDAASRLSANGEQGGAITVQSDAGTTLVSGAIDAKGAAGKGGDVQLLGNHVGLIGASVDASGTTGGGTVLAGGDYQGKNPNVQNASATYMSADSAISADAIANGSGGKVVLWANDSTRAYGSITARGGAQSGDGGLIETSGHWLDVAGIKVNAGAPHGKSGMWLLDPADVTITGAVDSGGTYNNLNPDVFTPSSGMATANVNLTTITTALNLGTDVTITTANSGASGAGAGDISVNAAITWSVIAPTTPSTLTLSAVRDVNVNQAITATRGSFTANAGRNVNVSAVITTTGDGVAGNGNVVLRAGNNGTGPGTAAGTVVFLAGGSVTMTSGAASIYYNPSAYATPTNYLGNFSLTTSTLNSYMWLFADTALVAQNKIYNGTTAATLSTPFIFKSGPLGVPPPPDGTTVGQRVSLIAGAANFNSKDVATANTVNFTGYTLGSADAGSYALFGQPASQAASITAKALSMSGLSVPASKIYDANLVAVVSGTPTLAVAEAPGTGTTADGKAYTGDIVAITGTATGTYNFKDVAGATPATTVTYGGLALNNTNYSLTIQTPAAATITVKPLTATVTAPSKIYDGNTTAAPTLAVVAAGLVGTETVTATGTATFNSKDVLTANLVTVNTTALVNGLNGGFASNYSLVAGQTVADTITAKPLTATVTAPSKVYDGNTTAAPTLAVVAAGLVGTETVTATGAASFKS